MLKKNFTTMVSASPKARKFARELGVDINQVEGSETVSYTHLTLPTKRIV